MEGVHNSQSGTPYALVPSYEECEELKKRGLTQGKSYFVWGQNIRTMAIACFSRDVVESSPIHNTLCDAPVTKTEIDYEHRTSNQGMSEES